MGETVTVIVGALIVATVGTWAAWRRAKGSKPSIRPRRDPESEYRDVCIHVDGETIIRVRRHISELPPKVTDEIPEFLRR